MPVETQFNLALELAQVFNLGTVVKSGATALLSFARELRKSGTDIVVEEDLADIFGRGRIVPQLEESFRKEVVASATITAVYAGSEISLCSGPGPTVIRALKEKDRKYLSTVIQLSFLGWVHERDSLSEALSNCILERSKSLSDPYAVPGFEDIKGSLNACSSQTSSFIWDKYIRYVEHLLQTGSSGILYDHYNIGLSQSMLLAAMDYLYIVQRLPEDRSMLIKGFITREMVFLVVWAHCILGLSVFVQNAPGKNVTFGASSRPQLTILISNTERQDKEILLLDREIEVVLRNDTLQDSGPDSRITSKERHTLYNCGSDMLRQAFNSTIATADEHPVYLEAIKLIVAYTIAFNSNVICNTLNGADLNGAGFNSHQSDQWRIFDAIDVIFHDFAEIIGRAEISDINVYLEMVKDRSISDSIHLTSIGTYLNKYKTGNHVIMDLIGQLLTFAHASNVRELGMLPITQRNSYQYLTGLFHALKWSDSNATCTFKIRQRYFFDNVCAMIESEAQEQSGYRSSQVQRLVCSDFGWSVIIGNAGDVDPGEVDPFLFCVKKGVPTHTKTGERRKYIVDGPRWSTSSSVKVIDNGGGTFVPRCLMPVSQRVEYYSVRSEAFLLSIRFQIEELPGSESLVTSCGYGAFHEALSSALVTKTCGHPIKDLDVLTPLGPEVATTVGWSWATIDEDKLPRICISLVKGDSRARWLALAHASENPYWGTVLRSNDCCIECALQATTAMEGKWILIL
ncbi:MAG: hypothetical protein Q9167_007972 [Letrouitia subvulpina]